MKKIFIPIALLVVAAINSGCSKTNAEDNSAPKTVAESLDSPHPSNVYELTAKDITWSEFTADSFQVKFTPVQDKWVILTIPVFRDTSTSKETFRKEFEYYKNLKLENVFVTVHRAEKTYIEDTCTQVRIIERFNGNGTPQKEVVLHKAR